VDWWSLGALIYEMLSGRPPHYSKNRKEMMQNIVE
jgi:serum/glucocorticoid-regulated kinase 2